MARYLGDADAAAKARKKQSPFLDAPPGARHAYSNVGAALAALTVESIARERFDIYVRRTFFAPLHMSAAFRTSEVEKAALALPHVWRGGERFEERPLVGRAVYPASDLRASACSLGRFIAAIAAGGALDRVRVLEETSVRSMLEPVPLPTGGAAALGWQRFELEGRAVLGHEGEDDGASAVMAVDPERHAGAVVLANGDAFSSGDRKRAGAISDFLARLLRP
jgi:CubicO group peptidase (beta-lactamase class C family)